MSENEALESNVELLRKAVMLLLEDRLEPVELSHLQELQHVKNMIDTNNKNCVWNKRQEF